MEGTSAVARKSEGWSLKKDSRNGIYTVRFRHAGERIMRSTGQRDPQAAQVEAARIYAEVCSDRRAGRGPRGVRPLDVLMAEWLAQVEPELAPETWQTYQGYCANHLLPFFESVDRITTARAEDYMRARLRKVMRGSVAKELGALRGFLRWA